MNRRFLLPLSALLGGLLAFILRFLQNVTGFESDTGLAIPGNLPGMALIALLALLSLWCFLLSRRQPAAVSSDFANLFSTEDLRPLTLVISGIFLMALSGALELLGAVSAGSTLYPVMSADGLSFLPLSSGSFSVKGQLLLGLLILVSACSLFPVAAACRRREAPRPVPGTCLLLPVVCLTLRAGLLYRAVSINPVLAAYYVELLATVVQILAFFSLSSFAFQAGKPRRFSFTAALSVVLGLAALGDGLSAAAPLYLGSGLALLGFLLLFRPESTS